MEETPVLYGPCTLKGSLPLPFTVKAGYSVGHVLNDLCAATWFTYLLLFLESVGLTKVQAGLVMLCGQVSHGIMTPCVGILSDTCSRQRQYLGFGRRKLWHICGSFMVALCFSAVFAFIPYPVYTQGGSVMTCYYAIAASLFNIGWASVQVSHMALVPELHENPAVRTQLNAGRYAFTILSNAAVFILYMII
jgi:Na+/melibiose symporter-like transporter